MYDRECATCQSMFDCKGKPDHTRCINKVPVDGFEPEIDERVEKPVNYRKFEENDNDQGNNT